VAAGSDVDAALASFAALDETELARPWRFRDKPTDVRYAIYRTLEDAQGAYVQLTALHHPESRRILALAQRAFGDLRGLLVGLPAALLERVRAARAETHRRLDALPVAVMTRPTQWTQFDVDVRFRLHRFAAHLIEHGIQCEKTLAALGVSVPEGRRIVRRLTALLGEIEGLDGHAEARTIEQHLVERAASVAAD